jgi:hypothetical protein
MMDELHSESINDRNSDEQPAKNEDESFILL